MIKGTTAQFKFKIAPYTFGQILNAEIAFWQYNRNDGSKINQIIKNRTHCDAKSTDTDVYINLSPADTQEFSDESKAYVQFRALLTDEATHIGSKQYQFTVHPAHNDKPLEGSIEDMLPVQDGYFILDGGEI